MDSRSTWSRHCGHTLNGEHAWTLTVTDVFTGWTENIATRNPAYSRVVAAIKEVSTRLPYLMVGLDCDNGVEFINYALIGWCAERSIFMTRAPGAHLQRQRPCGAEERRHRAQVRVPLPHPRGAGPA